MKFSQEIRVGLLAIVAMAMFYFGFRFLKGSDFFSSNNNYTVFYPSVDGLTASNPVRINGLSVGRVKSIEILQDKGNQLRVVLEIAKKISVPDNSTALLADDGLLGGKLINLKLNPNGAPLAHEGTLIGAKETGLVASISDKATPVLTSADSLMKNLNRVVASFSKTALVLNQTLAGANQTLLGANRVTGTLDVTVQENRAALQTTLANVGKLSTSLIETERQLKPILTKAGTFADSLNALQLRQTLLTANATVASLQKILSDVGKGKGSLGKLTSDDALYANVNATTVSLTKLLTDLREHPKRYVHFSLFGRKPEQAPDQPIMPAPSPALGDSTQK
jgi:phospholipid/cholesterol/gamma-HCH transport system substrate-binding protein